MAGFKKLIALTVATALFGLLTARAEAATYSTDASGCGYEECRTAPALAPYIAVGAIALAAVVAVAVQNSHAGSTRSSHSH